MHVAPSKADGRFKKGAPTLLFRNSPASAKRAAAPRYHRRRAGKGPWVGGTRRVGIRHGMAISRREWRPKLRIDDALRKLEGAGKAGCTGHPQSCARDAHDGPQVRRITRPSLRNGFNGLWRALPGDEFVLPPSLTDWRSIEARSGSTNLHQLDASHGRQDHTLLPSAASRCEAP